MNKLSFPTAILLATVFTFISCTKNEDALLKETIYQHDADGIETKGATVIKVEANAIGWSTLYGPTQGFIKGGHAFWGNYPFGKTSRPYRSVTFYSTAHKLKTVNVVYSDGSKEEKTVSTKAHAIKISLRKGVNKKIHKLNAWTN
ncbi:MAG: hypothetical protein MI922_20015 [Bacteroidales bacterium]|nr:hypothetical protein [Bacteroidales bacterium]